MTSYLQIPVDPKNTPIISEKSRRGKMSWNTMKDELLTKDLTTPSQY